MFIVWGSKGRVRTAGRGEFFCPGCREAREFERKVAARWFTLYFVPIVQLEKLGSWIVCARCGGEFDQAVAEMTRGEIEALLDPWACTSCGNSNPGTYRQCLQCGAVREVRERVACERQLDSSDDRAAEPVLPR